MLPSLVSYIRYSFRFFFILRRGVADIFCGTNVIVLFVGVIFPTDITLVSFVNVFIDSPTFVTLSLLTGIIRKRFFVCYDIHVLTCMIFVSVVIASLTFLTMLRFFVIIGNSCFVYYEIYVRTGLNLMRVIIDSLNLLSFSCILGINALVSLWYEWDVIFLFLLTRPW